MPTPEGLLTSKEAATLAKRTISTISLWVRTGHLPYTRAIIHYRPVLLFRADDVLRVSATKDAYCKVRNYRKPHCSRVETMEDVERVIAEQSKCLPSWWWDDTTKMQGMRVKDLVRCKDDE